MSRHGRHGGHGHGGQSNEDRDLDALNRRRAATKAEEDEVAIDERPTGELGAPFSESYEDITRPTQLIERDSGNTIPPSFRDDLKAAQDRYDRDPAFRAMWNMSRRSRHESEKSLGVVANAAMSAHAAPAPELEGRINQAESRLDKIDTVLSISKWFAAAIVMIVLGGVGGVAWKIYDSGFERGQLELRVQDMQKQLEHLVERTQAARAAKPD